MLQAMGIQIWYPREATVGVTAQTASVEASVSPVGLDKPQVVVKETSPHSEVTVPAGIVDGPSSSEKPTTAPLVDTVEPVRFAWMKGQHALALIPDGADVEQAAGQHASDAYLRFVADVIAYVDWLHGTQGTTHQRGEFRWPLLGTGSINTPGSASPASALGAFADKYCASVSMVLMSETLFAASSSWRTALPDPIVSLPYDRAVMRTGELKQALALAIDQSVVKRKP